MIRGECLPLVQNHDAEEPSALAVASYTDVEEEATVASNSSTGRTVNHEQTEGLQNQPGLMFEYISSHQSSFQSTLVPYDFKTSDMKCK